MHPKNKYCRNNILLPAEIQRLCKLAKYYVNIGRSGSKILSELLFSIDVDLYNLSSQDLLNTWGEEEVKMY